MLSPMLVRPALTPGLKTPLYVVMRMLALVMFCISFGWAQQLENESVNRSSDASPAQPRTSQAAAPTVPLPTHEMQRLANMLAGRWSVGQAFEPRGGPKGVVGQGTEVWRPGPGARSLIEELRYVWPAETTSPAAPREQDETVAQPATENTRNSPLPNTQSASSSTSTLPRDMIFDNPQIRIRDIKKEPRQKTAIHSVPPLLIVALTPVHNLLTLADGSTKEESITAGDVAWWNGGERGGENLEDKPQEFLTVFPKEPEAGAADVTLPLGELGVQNPEMAHAMIFDNDRFRVSRMSKLPRQPSKLHDAPGRLLVFLTDGHLRCTFPSRPAIDNVAKPGDVAWWPPGMHVSENVGEQEIKFLLIVPKLQNYRPSNP